MPLFELPKFASRHAYQHICSSSSAEHDQDGVGTEASQDVDLEKLSQHHDGNSRASPFATGFWILLLVCLAQSAVIIRNLPYEKWARAAKSPMPYVPTTSTIFHSEPSMMGLKTAQDVLEAWNSSMMLGFVHVADPSRHYLTPNTHVLPGISNSYMISAYHQLHCLKELHLAFVEQKNLGALDRRHEDNEHPQGAQEKPHVMSWLHAEHCFSYLRQGIMCAGDTTLEGPDPGEKTLMGWGAKHQCRKWDGEGGIDTWAREKMNEIEELS